MASEDESNHQTNMQSLERSDTDVVSRRESVRLKLMHLNNEVAQAIVEEFEHMDHFFGQTEAHTREQIEQYSATVDANLETIEANYNELDRLTENKTDLETIKNMFDLCTSKIAVNRQKLTVLLEEMDQPKQDDEEDLQEASATFATHMEKFNQLLSRMREREANTITEATPSAYSRPTVMPTRTNNAEVNVESYNSIGAQDTGLQVIKDLTTSLIASMRATKRQSLAPAVYHGDPITFTEWEMDFDAYVETEGLTNIEPLRHLKRFVSGKAYDAISGHFLTNTLSAYYDARAVLKDRFGNKHSVSRALRKKLSEFSKIGPKNSSLLREYADLLAHVRSAMSDVTQLNILDDSEENEKLVAKLPDFMIRSWVKTVKERRQARKPYPDFKEFTSFVIDHAEIMEEPLMQLTSMNLKDKPKQQRIYPSARVSALATSTGYANSCICCKKPHATAECYTLRDMKAAQQEAFVKQHRLCFGCLGSSDHRSKECPKRATCKKCQKRHPTALHREPHEWERNRSTDTKAPETQTNTSGGMKMETKPNKQYTSTLKESQGNTAREDSLQKTKKLDVKFTSCAEKGLNMILPVYVSSQFDPQKEVLIYAMLDSQSDSTFLTTDVGGMLNTDTTIEDVQMETLNGSTLEKINLHHNILVRGFHECTKLSIAAYAWNDFSCDKDQIPTRDNLAKYEHLVEISKFLPPLLDIPVAMLIGRDCSDAFAPIEAIRGRKGQPFAEKTVLGWTAMGSGKRQNGRKTPRVSVNACNTFAKILSDDSDTLSSQDDIKFMEIWSTGTVQRNDEYFQMPLPFRSRSKLPNNRLQAALLATWLSKTPQHELDLRIDEEHYWSDSQIVLSYIANDSKRFQIYVANRVHEIREHSQVTQWHHIAGEHNPADIASRGIEFHKLMKSIRFHGPEFLKEKQTYPSAKQSDFQAKLGQTDPEVRRIKNCNTKMKQPNPVLKLIEHFSTKIRLLRVVGTLQKMVHNKSWKLEPLEAVKCVTCRTLRGKSSSQQMGDLPLERTGKYPPFRHTGMNCFGPFEVKERRTELKKYGLVFTCLYTRGIHTELLDDLSTNAFLNALRCFISIRGHVKTLYSDNGTNFIGAKNEFDKQLKNMVDNEAKQILANMQINFIMSTPTASHQGGVWERQIRTIRSILDDVFYKHKGRFDTSMLRTAFCEVMATANSRPLSLVDVNDPEELPITPNALLTGKPEPTPPPPGEFTTESYAKARWKEVQCLAEAFWQKWKVTYFDEITKRQKWADIKVNLAKGDVVLLVEHDMPRNHWRKAIVEETYPGSDGLVRKVSVRLASKFLSSKGKPMEKRTILHRPVQKLVKLV